MPSPLLDGRRPVVKSPCPFFKSRQRSLDYFIWRYISAPIIRNHVRGPSYERLRSQIAIDRIRTSKSGDPEKRSDGLWVTDCLLDRGDAASHLMLRAIEGQTLEGERVIQAVRPNGMAVVIDSADEVGKGLSHLADQKKVGFDALRFENAQDGVGIGRKRPVIERQDNFMVLERQSLLILQRSNVSELAGAYS